MIVVGNTNLKVSGVYCLKDPETGKIRYVGQSKNIHNRYYYGHLKSDRVSSHPVTSWVNKLKDSDKIPSIEILEICENPIDVEKQWIDKIKSQGHDLLNIHGGGRIPASVGNGKTTKIWSVEGMPSPWVFLCRSFYAKRSNKSIDDRLKELKKERDSKKSEFDILQFELFCARILLDAYHESSKQVHFAEKWLMGVAGKVNKKYPNTVIVMSVDGVRLT